MSPHDCGNSRDANFRLSIGCNICWGVVLLESGTGIEVKEAGLATHYIPSSHLPLIRQQLQQAGPAAADLSHVNSILTDIEAQAAAAAGQSTATCSSLSRRLPVIARCFGKKTVSEVVNALQTERAEQEFCREALQQLQR